MADQLLALTTAIAPPVVFTIDGEEYQIIGTEHQSKVEEAKTAALYARYLQLATKLAKAPNRDRAERYAAGLYELRMELLTSLTTAPRELVEKLPFNHQLKLMAALQQGDDDDEELEELDAEDEL